MTSYPKPIPKATCSAEFIASNDDLLTQILVRLPIKSVAQFKSVSKNWFSLISSLSKPVLALLMHNRDNSPHLDLMPLDHPETTATPPFFPFRSLSFLGDAPRRMESCNGLVLFYHYQPIKSMTIYNVYNPTTNKYATLPPAPPEPHDTFLHNNIAFDPSRSPYYNVVSFHISRSAPYWCQVDTYSSETRQWSRFRDSFALQFYTHSYKKRVFWNGAIHWITREGSFRFDMVKQKMIENPMPPTTDKFFQRSDNHFNCFGVSSGQLYLINGSASFAGHLNIYKMERDCSCWNLKHRVDVTANLMASFPDFIWRTRQWTLTDILFFSDHDSFLVVRIASQVIRYDFKIGTFTKICDLPSYRIRPTNTPLFDTHPYFESLCSLW